jgi:sec-independent protein translocase protein TatA
MFKNLGPMELGIILLIVVMIFGVGKLPEVGSAIGKSIRAFKKSQDSEDDEDVEESPKPKKRKAVKKVTSTSAAEPPVSDKPATDKPQSA